MRKYLEDARLRAGRARRRRDACTLDAATIMAQTKRGELDGAWLPEPWATRVVLDAKAVLASTTSATSGPGERLPTAIVGARPATSSRAGRKPAGRRRVHIAAAIGDEVERALRPPKSTLDIAQRRARALLLGKALLKKPTWTKPATGSTSPAIRSPTPSKRWRATPSSLNKSSRTDCRTLFADPTVSAR